jgi:AraC-like DNA-binding protein
MTTQSILPPASIANYVSSIAVIEHTDPHGNIMMPLIANGYPCIAFQIAGSALTLGNVEKIGNLVLYGQFVKPEDLHAKGLFTIIAYFLYPPVLKQFFGYNAREFTNTYIDLSLQQPAREMNLKEQLLNAASLDKRLQLINTFIGKLAVLNYADMNKAIFFATQAIRKSQGLLSLKELQQELYITERTFQRLFESHVGVSPKLFSRICQFHAAFQQLNVSRPGRLIDIAYTTGYADESHFIRSFKEFTNCSPKEYLKKSAEFIA